MPHANLHGMSDSLETLERCSAFSHASAQSLSPGTKFGSVQKKKTMTGGVRFGDPAPRTEFVT